MFARTAGLIPFFAETQFGSGGMPRPIARRMRNSVALWLLLAQSFWHKL
jgi:hypothetical protein